MCVAISAASAQQISIVLHTTQHAGAVLPALPTVTVLHPTPPLCSLQESQPPATLDCRTIQPGDTASSTAAPPPLPAGLAYKGDTWGAAEAQATLDTNYFGTAAACEALTPLMAPGARVINVCSM
jgi:NAD(P)-dependent dehydrogenase (short-subunit alcohol dehydrogenase family)